MQSKIWRLRALVLAPDALAFNVLALRLCDVNGPLDADAVLSCPLPVTGDGLGALTDGDASTSAVFDAADIQSSGWAIQWSFSSAVEATYLQIDADPLYGIAIEAMGANGTWELVIERAQDAAISGTFSLDRISKLMAVFTKVNEVRSVNIPLGGSVSQDIWDGGVRSNVSTNSMMFAFDSMPQAVNFKGMKAYFDFKITADSLSRRHAGFWLFDPARPTYGYRIATLDGTIGLSYFPGALGTPEVVYQQLPMPKGALAVNTMYRMGVSVDSAGAITVTINDEFVVVFNPPGVLLPTVRIGAFFYVGSYVAYSCGLVADVYSSDTRSPIAAALPVLKDIGEAPGDAQFARDDAPPLAIDVEFGGAARIYGTVARNETPANVPLIRRVRLHRSRDGALVRETWSKADGSYEFTEISGRYEYDVIAWDHEMQFRSVVANNLVPEVMP